MSDAATCLVMTYLATGDKGCQMGMFVKMLAGKTGANTRPSCPMSMIQRACRYSSEQGESSSVQASCIGGHMGLSKGSKARKAHLIAIEPEAAKGPQDARLQELDPARVQLHDDCKGAVGRQDDVVNHACVVADPDMVWPGVRPRPMIPHHPCSHQI